MKTTNGYSCDSCSSVLVLDTELDDFSSFSFANQSHHACDFCVFGVVTEHMEASDANS